LKWDKDLDIHCKPKRRSRDDLFDIIKNTRKNYFKHIESYYVYMYKDISESTIRPPTSPNNPTGLSGGTYVCEICNIAYHSREDLEKHNSLAHPDRKIEQL
jgi:hypothetical protein